MPVPFCPVEEHLEHLFVQQKVDRRERLRVRACEIEIGNLALAVQELESSDPLSKEVVYLLDFIKSSERGVCFGPRGK